MTQHAKTKEEIVTDIRALADKCLDVATDADYFGGFDPDMMRVAKLLLHGSAALMLLADGVAP